MTIAGRQDSPYTKNIFLTELTSVQKLKEFIENASRGPEYFSENFLQDLKIVENYLSHQSSLRFEKNKAEGLRYDTLRLIIKKVIFDIEDKLTDPNGK